ncbi:MAG: tRNA/rRNA methyltransferase [Parcubacteria group bacterium GW2011_GWA2_47_12]|nr:MAG: tRNA/rRNA methyltransferase [Parcubacteria group bacterium GW2011_GWA2_47_12]
MYILLHNIRSNHNVGSIFRTADAAGVAKIFLAGYTPAPVDRFGRINKELAKTALGAEKTVVWERARNISPLLARLKKEKVLLVAVEQHPRAISYKKIPRRKNIAFIFGNEVRGLPESILKQCDCIAEIPMRGSKESLNVAVATGVVLFSVYDKILSL